MVGRWLFDVYAFAAGLVVGSYLNVVIHRLPRGLSTILPRSACPYCGGAIRARDNIPLLSFALLRGRCRHCSAPIGWRYAAVEALTGLLFVACLERFGLTAMTLVATLFCSLMVALAAIDVDHLQLPDRLTLPGIVAGLALQPWIPEVDWLDALLGALAGAGLLILVINTWYWLRSEEGMGLGDVNMLAMIGAFLGWQGALTTLLLAAVAGAVTGLALVFSGRLGMRSPLPFGLFLAIGGVAALLLGPALPRAWIDLF